MSSPSPPPLPSLSAADEPRSDVFHLGEVNEGGAGTAPASLPPARVTKRTCALPTCSRVLPSASHDPHTVCIACRGFCADADRCEECAGWEVSVVESARSYQSKLRRHRSRHDGFSGGSGQVPTGDAAPASEGADSRSSVSSVSPHDSASQAGASPLAGLQTSLLAPGSAFQSLLSDMISSQVSKCLANLANVPASSLPQAECLASSRPTSPISAAPSSVHMAHQAEWSRGGSLGNEPPSGRAGKRAARAVYPASIKRSRAEVGGSVVPPPRSLSPVRDQGGAFAAVLGPLAHPRPLGEGQTACSVVEREALPATQSLGVGERESSYRHPSPLSTRHTEVVQKPRHLSSVRKSHHTHPRPTASPWRSSVPGGNQASPHRSSSTPVEGEVRGSQAPPPRPSTSFGVARDYERRGGGSDSSEEDERAQEPSTFTAMMDFVFERFPEARGVTNQDSAPLLPGMQHGEVSAAAPRLARAPPIGYMMDQASAALARANETPKAAFARYPSRRSLRCYRTGMGDGGNRAARINPDLLSHLTVRGDPRVTLPHGEAVRLEEALLSIRDTQNFLFWLMGTYASLASSKDGLTRHGPMMSQLLHSIQRAMMDQSRLTAVTLANTRAARREAYLSHLPHRFNAVSRAQLRRSPVDSELLFDAASVDKAIDLAQKAASVSFTEAAAKALSKPKPKPGTPMVEKHPRPSTSVDSRPRPGPSQQRGSTSSGRSPRFSTRRSQDSSRSTVKNQPFRK